MTTTTIRPWKDCPRCEGQGELGYRDTYNAERAWDEFVVTPETVGEFIKIFACPTCLAHWRGVDEAVRLFMLRVWKEADGVGWHYNRGLGKNDPEWIDLSLPAPLWAEIERALPPGDYGHIVTESTTKKEKP